jgi:hypothetical protein
MTTETYKRLIDEICQMAQIPNAQLMYQSADLRIDDVNFTLIEAGLGDEDGLALYCDFGPLPTHRREQVLERLMQLNLAMHGINTPVFSLNQETGHVLLARRIVLRQITALEVMDMLAVHAAQAKQWAQTHYLHDPDKPVSSMHKNRNPRLFNTVA